MRCYEAIRKPVVSVGPEATLAEAAAMMEERGVGALVIAERGALLGIVTDRDLVVRAVRHRLPHDTRVEAVMTTDVTTMDASADLREALRVFEQRPFRRLPLLEGERVVGVLTVDDLLVDLVGDIATVVRPITGQLPPRPR